MSSSSVPALGGEGGRKGSGEKPGFVLEVDFVFLLNRAVLDHLGRYKR